MPLTNEQIATLKEKKCFEEANDLMRRAIDHMSHINVDVRHDFDDRYSNGGIALGANIGAKRFEACMARASAFPVKGH